MTTPEQVQANQALVAAIEACAKVHGMLEEGWALGDWVVCTEFVPFAEDLIGRQKYAFMTPEPTIPIHRIQGLLTITENDLYGDPRDDD